MVQQAEYLPAERQRQAALRKRKQPDVRPFCRGRETTRSVDYMGKAAKQVVTYCIRNDIGTLIVGYNTTFQRSLRSWQADEPGLCGNSRSGYSAGNWKYLCEMNGIRYVEQEESYTSMASFWDLDEMPVYGEAGLVPLVFSGRRICRGLYQDRSGRRINADVNGALNIMRKLTLWSLRALYDRGDVDTPVRIRIA